MKGTAHNRDEWLAWNYSEERAAERARYLEMSRAETTGFESERWEFRHRNGSGNGAAFVTAIVEDAIVVTFLSADAEGNAYETGKVAIPLSAAAAATELPPVDAGGLVTTISAVNDRIDGDVAVLVREARTKVDITWVEHFGRHLVFIAPRHPGCARDRFAVLDLHLAAVERDVTFVNNGWRPEDDAEWAAREMAVAGL